MTTKTQLIITESRVEAYIASALRLLGWLLGAILRGGWKGRSARLKHSLSRAEHAVERILFLKAAALYGPLPDRRRRHAFAPQGFRRVKGNGRLFFRGANVRAGKAGALQRVLTMIAALTRPQRAVAYFFKRICKGLHFTHLAAVAPPASALARDALAAAACPFADTS